jgi:hypothetical protein
MAGTRKQRPTKQATIGAQYGRWTALMQVGRVVHCVCVCGTKREVYVYNLTAGKTLSCGCYCAERTKEAKTGVPLPEAAKKHLSEVQSERWKQGYYADMGRARAGELATGLGAKGPQHVHSKEWAVRSPCGTVIQGRDLMHLIRENASLFNKEDAEFKKNEHGTDLWCRADRGLRKLFAPKPRNQWKGWTRA